MFLVCRDLGSSYKLKAYTESREACCRPVGFRRAMSWLDEVLGAWGVWVREELMLWIDSQLEIISAHSVSHWLLVSINTVSALAVRRRPLAHSCLFWYQCVGLEGDFARLNSSRKETMMASHWKDESKSWEVLVFPMAVFSRKKVQASSVF